MRAASRVFAAGACLIVVGVDNKEDGMNSGVDRWSTGSPSSQCCSCSMHLKKNRDMLKNVLYSWPNSMPNSLTTLPLLQVMW